MNRLKICMVSGCGNTSRNSAVRFHYFPTLEERFKSWVAFCQNERLSGLEPKECSHYFVCSEHFTSSSYQNALLVKLNRNAVPSLRAPVHSPYHVPQVSPPVHPLSISPIPVEPKNLILPRTPFQPSNPLETLPSLPSTSTSTPRCVSRLSFGPPIPDVSDISLGCLPLEESSEPSFVTSSVTESVDNVTDAGSTSLSTGSGKRKRKSLTLSHLKMRTRAELTPLKEKLLNYGQRRDKAFFRLQKKYWAKKKELREISFCKSKQFLQKQMSSAAATILTSQIRCSKKKPQGRRWTIEEKILALSLYKRSPRCYPVLSNLFVLPCKRTLKSLVNSVPFTAGINDAIFTTLKHSLKEMSDRDRLCYLIFDEMSLREGLRYNSKFDCIDGLEDRGHLGRTNLAAKYALVFMLRGLVRKWKQPVAFYFSNSGMSSEYLSELIKQVLGVCFDAGANVMATVCDLGSSNRAALNCLKGEKSLPTDDPVFSFRDKSIVTIFDPPHLLKCARNSLLKYDAKCVVSTPSLQFEGVASWQHIATVYDEDRKGPIRILKKLTDTHLAPDSRAKMNVSIAAQVLSNTVAGVLQSGVRTGLLSHHGLSTASYCKLFDDLMDSFNGCLQYPKDGAPLKVRLEARSPHWQMWEEALRSLEALRFIVPPRVVGQAPKEKKMPFQHAWVMSIKAMKLLWTNIKSFNRTCENLAAEVHYLQLRYLNQDALENVFGLIRSHCGCNDHPTMWQFVDALKTCIINGLAFRDILRGSNCIDDDAELLSNLRQFLCGNHEPGVPEDDNIPTSKPVDNIMPVTVDSDEARYPGDSVMRSTAYVSGYIAKRLWDLGPCESCRSVLCCVDTDLFLHEFIESREKDPNQRRLTYPSESLISAVAWGVTFIDKMLDADKKMADLIKTLTGALEREIEFSWLHNVGCGHGNILLQKFLRVLCIICVIWWCTKYNRRVKESAKLQRKLRKLNVL